jgi:hypothetical protein
MVAGHENTRLALRSRALSSEASDLLGLVVNLVVLENVHLDLLSLLSNLLGLGVGLLLSLLLTTTTKAEHQVEGRLLLDVVVSESAAILELLASEDQALLIWRNT